MITNANVFTGDPARPHAQAVAIRDAKIVAVGDDAAVDPFVVASTEVLDAGGRLMIPGLNDAHVHFGARPGGFRLELPSPEPTLDEVVA
ncbi:MAG: amidohydrolase, partial [Thermoanaerobaculia bacterium]